VTAVCELVDHGSGRRPCRVGAEEEEEETN
jgi:hypothetical protein